MTSLGLTTHVEGGTFIPWLAIHTPPTHTIRFGEEEDPGKGTE